MKNIPDDMPAATLTELLHGEETRELLTLNGYSGRGSDYEIFRDLCACISGMPEHPGAVKIRRGMEMCFGIAFSPERPDRDAIWKRTAEILREMPICRKDLPVIPLPATEETILPSGIYRSLFCNVPEERRLSDLPLPPEQGGWKDWSAQAETILGSFRSEHVPFGMTLPADLVVRRPTLYDAERFLSGEERNMDLWIAQLTFFLFRFCAEHNLRPLIRTKCAPEVFAELLRQISRLTRLPDLFWLPEVPVSPRTLLAVCEEIVKNRAPGKEGVPPVYLLSRCTERSDT